MRVIQPGEIGKFTTFKFGGGYTDKPTEIVLNQNLVSALDVLRARHELSASIPAGSGTSPRRQLRRTARSAQGLLILAEKETEDGINQALKRMSGDDRVPEGVGWEHFKELERRGLAKISRRVVPPEEGFQGAGYTAIEVKLTRKFRNELISQLKALKT